MKILLLGFSKKKRGYTVKRLVTELKKRGHTVNYLFWEGLVFSFSKKGVSIKRAKGTDLKYYDFIIPRNPRNPFVKNRAQMSQLYRHYVLLVDYINRHHKHVLNEKTTKKIPFYDKLLQHYVLASNDLPVVPTRLYTGSQLPGSVYRKFKKPYIVKSIEGSRGKQVFMVEDESEVSGLIDEFGVGKLLVQKLVPVRHDYRIIVIGNQVIGGMKRTAADQDFRSNFSAGGSVEKIKITPEMKNLAIRATKVFGAEFAGIDLIKHKGKYYILEVNIFPGFEGFESATGINVAEELAAYIEKKYLWTLETEFTKKEKREFFGDLYNIEKQNLEKPSLDKKGFRETLLKRDLITINKELKPIAYLTHYKKDGVRRITRYGILPQHRGQRMGRRMLRALVKISKADKDQKVNAVVPLTNKKRQTTFKRAGFRKTDEVLKDHFGESGDGVVYEYIINPEKRVKGPGLTKQKTKKGGKKIKKTSK